MASGGGMVYAVKGNKTRELWRYDLSTDGRGGVMAQGTVASLHGFTVSPNPLAGLGVVRFAGLPVRPVALTLFDVSGRVCWNSVCPSGRMGVTLDWSRIPAGVYFLAASDGQSRLGCKVVVTR